MTTARTCSVEGCDGKHYANSFCCMHNARFKTHGNVETVLVGGPPKSNKTCSIIGCDRKHKAKELCKLHYNALHMAKRYIEDHDHVLSRNKEWRNKNPDKVAKSKRKYDSSNREKINEKARNWAHKNKDKTNMYAMRWQNKNVDCVKEIRIRSKRKAIDEISDTYLRTSANLPLDTPKEILEIYRKLLKLKRALK